MPKLIITDRSGKKSEIDFDSNFTLIQGIQQNIELFTLSNLELTEITINASIHPNPTKDNIVLSFNNYKLEDLNYIMYDLSGRVVAKGKVQQEDTLLIIQNIAKGNYILKVKRKNQELKMFKVIKK